MIRVVHLLDRSTGWEQRVAISQLLRRLPTGEYTQTVATIDPGTTGHPFDPGVAIAPLTRWAGVATFAGAAVRRYADRGDIDLIHAWGVDAGAAARAAYPTTMPIAVTVFNPGAPDRDVRVLRTIGAESGFAVVCAAERVRQRLVERGVPVDACAVVRPAVDFARIKEADQRSLREEIGAPSDGPLVLTPERPSRAMGHYPAIWSVLMRWYLDENARVIVPGRGPEFQDLRRLAKASECPEVAIFTENRFPFEDLCAAADYLVVAATGEIPTTSMAWAMAASTPVIAAATYSTAELLSNDLNGLLFKAPRSWRRMGALICGMYDRTDHLAKIKEVARGQAYEVFSLQRFVEQHRQLYDNLRSGTPPDTGITDPALATS